MACWFRLRFLCVFYVLLNTASLYVMGLFFVFFLVALSLVVSTSIIYGLERLVSETICYVWRWMDVKLCWFGIRNGIWPIKNPTPGNRHSTESENEFLNQKIH